MRRINVKKTYVALKKYAASCCIPVASPTLSVNIYKYILNDMLCFVYICPGINDNK